MESQQILFLKEEKNEMEDCGIKKKKKEASTTREEKRMLQKKMEAIRRKKNKIEQFT